MDKKEKKIKWYNKWYNIILTIIVSICIYLSMLLCIYSLFNIKKSNAYTNNVIPYADEQVTNLINTTWLLNDNLSNADNISLNINFISNETEFTSFEFVTMVPMGSDRYYLAYNGMPVYSNGTWNNENYKTITITSSFDNSYYIEWFYNNATLQTNEEFYNINYNLQNVIVIGEKPTKISNREEINIEFQNFKNYELPQNIMVENASYNWNQETGILKINGATGNITITIRAEYMSGNYSFIELIDSVILIPLNTFFNLFNFDIFGVNIYALLTATLTLFIIIKVLLKVFK